MKKQANTIFNTVFAKYLFSYLLLLLIPTMVILFFINIAVFPMMKNIMTNNGLATLARVQLVADTNIQQIETISTQISLNKNMHADNNVGSVPLSISVMETLKQYVMTNSFLHDIAIYFHGDNIVYTSTSTHTLDHFTNSSLRYDIWQPTEVLNSILNIESTLVRPAEKAIYMQLSSSLITKMQKIYLPHTGSAATVVFLLRNNFLQAMLSANGAGDDTFYYVLNGNDVVSSVGDEKLLQGISFETQKPNMLLKTNETIDINGEEMLMCSVFSPETGLRYVSFTPFKFAYAAIMKLQAQMLIVMAGLMILGTLLIVISMRANYRPIKRLSTYAKALMPHLESNHNEFGAIRSSLEGLSAEYQSLLENTKISQKIHAIQKILHGEYNDVEQFNVEFDSLEMHFDKSCFFVFLLMFEKPIPIKKLLSLEAIINKSLQGYLQMGNFYEKHLFVANINEQQRSTYAQLLNQVHDDLKRACPDISILLSGGGIYDSIQNVPVSYKEAVVAGDYRFVQGKDCVITQEQIMQEQQYTYSYPHQIFERLRYALLKGETENFYPALTEIIACIKAPGCPLFYARSLAYEIINVLSSVLKELGDEDFSGKIMADSSVLLSEFTTIDELIESMQSISLNICYYVVQNILNADKELVTLIKNYIASNYANADFSVQSLAEVYNMTQVTISQYFKTQTGSTVIDYITNVRMEAAKQMLLESDCSLDKIVEKIGYINTSSFIRRFKQLYGLTPRQFTEKYKNQKIKDKANK